MLDLHQILIAGAWKRKGVQQPACTADTDGMNLFCEECGSTVPAAARFCSGCGTVRPEEGGMVPAAAPISFDASKPPEPGKPVPRDCVWAQHPYPGHVPAGAKVKGIPPQRIRSLGTLTGRPFAEIVSFAGRPTASQELISGDRAFTWSGKDFWSTTHHIVLVFDRYGVCRGVGDQGSIQSSGPGIGIGFGIGFGG